jgi:hypothetical protein
MSAFVELPLKRGQKQLRISPSAEEDARTVGMTPVLGVSANFHGRSLDSQDDKAVLLRSG